MHRAKPGHELLNVIRRGNAIKCICKSCTCSMYYESLFEFVRGEWESKKGDQTSEMRIRNKIALIIFNLTGITVN